jgi:hypothetical protein
MSACMGISVQFFIKCDAFGNIILSAKYGPETLPSLNMVVNPVILFMSNCSMLNILIIKVAVLDMWIFQIKGITKDNLALHFFFKSQILSSKEATVVPKVLLNWHLSLFNNIHICKIY